MSDVLVADELLEAMVTPAAEAIEDAAFRLLGRDLGTVNRDEIVREGLEAGLTAVFGPGWREGISREWNYRLDDPDGAYFVGLMPTDEAQARVWADQHDGAYLIRRVVGRGPWLPLEDGTQ